MNRFTHCVLLIFALLSSRSFTAEINERYVFDKADWPPVSVIYDTQTSTTAGLLRYDSRGAKLYDLTCGSDPEFQSFLTSFIGRLQSGDESRATESLALSSLPADISLAGTDSPSSSTKPAPVSQPGKYLVMDEMASTETERIRKLVEERGAAAGLRAMAAEQMSAYADQIPETSGVMSVASYGTFSGVINSSGYIMHPKMVAEDLRAQDEFKDARYVEIYASVAAEAGYLKELANLLNMPVYGPDSVINYRGFASADRRLYSKRELDLARTAVQDGQPGAAFFLYEYYDNMALIDIKNRKELLKQAHDWLYKSAEGGVPVAQYNAAYLALWQDIWPKEKAAEWIKKLEGNPAALKQIPDKNLKYLKLDLENATSGTLVKSPS